MKELRIEPQQKFVEKVRCILEVEVSTKNLISDGEYDRIISDIFSAFDSAKLYIHLLVTDSGNDRIKIKLDIRYAEVNDFLLGALELFVHYLGNVRVYHKKIEYRLSI